MAERCTSDFSRQRAIVVTNPVATMVAAVLEAIENIDLDGEADVKRVLVQLDQLTNRDGVCGDARDAMRRASLEARQSFEAGDLDAAVDHLRELTVALRVSPIGRG